MHWCLLAASDVRYVVEMVQVLSGFKDSAHKNQKGQTEPASQRARYDEPGYRGGGDHLTSPA